MIHFLGEGANVIRKTSSREAGEHLKDLRQNGGTNVLHSNEQNSIHFDILRWQWNILDDTLNKHVKVNYYRVCFFFIFIFFASDKKSKWWLTEEHTLA